MPLPEEELVRLTNDPLGMVAIQLQPAGAVTLRLPEPPLLENPLLVAPEVVSAMLYVQTAPFCTTLTAGNTLPVVVLVTVIVALRWPPEFWVTWKAIEDPVPVDEDSITKDGLLLTALQGQLELSVTALLGTAAELNVKLPDVMVSDEQGGVCCVIVYTAARSPPASSTLMLPERWLPVVFASTLYPIVPVLVPVAPLVIEIQEPLITVEYGQVAVSETL